MEAEKTHTIIPERKKSQKPGKLGAEDHVNEDIDAEMWEYTRKPSYTRGSVEF